MLIYILGHKGWIGKMFIKIFESYNISYKLSTVRGEDDTIFEEMKGCTHVLCCIGRTYGTHNGFKYNTIDYLEHSETLEENINDNLYVPVRLAIYCSQNKIHFTYLGTGCIYTYEENISTKEPNVLETTLPNFKGSKYSLVKSYTNNLINMLPVLHLRIRMPITSEKSHRNLIDKIVNYKKICSIPNSMSILDELVPISVEMIINNITGTFNLTNPGVISHNEILELYRDIVDPNHTWENMSVEEQDKLLLGKRSNNFMDTQKLEIFHKIYASHLPLHNIKEGLEMVMEKYNALNKI